MSVNSGGGRPTVVFYIAVAAVIGGLVYFAGKQAGFFGEVAENDPAPRAGGSADAPDIDPGQINLGATSGGVLAEGAAPGAAAATTVKDYEYVPAERLPAVTGTAAYQKMNDNTVRFALNVWAGWAPIIHANGGFQPDKVWKTPDGKEFRVHLILADDPITMRNAYAAGEYHIGWATVDMLPLFMEGFVNSAGEPKDSRVMPRIFQQVDWSNGGDGIVVRDNIRTVSDLKGKTIALAQNSPSQYFALSMLVAGGLQPRDVKFKFLTDAFEAAAAFNTDKSVAACVSWAPDIYNLSEQDGNRMLVDTGTANKLIADVWYARADFAKDHPDIIEGIVRGIFDSMEALDDQAEQQKVAGWMAKGYAIPADECLAMLGDAHSTNFAENRDFFLNANNPTRFESVWDQAYYVYKQIRTITHQPVSFDKVVDFSILQKLAKEEKYASQQNEYRIRFTPKTADQVFAESTQVLSNAVIIQFSPNNSDLHFMAERRRPDGTVVQELYDPNVDLTLEGIAKLVSTFGAARVVIEGHTDSSMRSLLNDDDTLVKQLSANRAAAVKEELVNKFQLDPNQLNSVGMGWDQPHDPDDPLNHDKNRRVEVRVFSAEAQ